MTTPVQRNPSNIRRSIQKAIKDRLETPNTDPLGLALVAGFVDYQDDEYDNSVHDQWVRLERVSGGAGSWERSLYQLTCFSRSAGDRAGALMDALLNVTMDAMRQERGEIVMYNWADTDNPVEIDGKKVLVVNDNGYHGEPSDGPALVEAVDGVVAYAVTYLVGIYPDDWTSEKWRAP